MKKVRDLQEMMPNEENIKDEDKKIAISETKIILNEMDYRRKDLITLSQKLRREMEDVTR
jgi:hypothetical protein